jgi:hypothetical protein
MASFLIARLVAASIAWPIAGVLSEHEPACLRQLYQLRRL